MLSNKSVRYLLLLFLMQRQTSSANVCVLSAIARYMIMFTALLTCRIMNLYCMFKTLIYLTNFSFCIFQDESEYSTNQKCSDFGHSLNVRKYEIQVHIDI